MDAAPVPHDFVPITQRTMQSIPIAVHSSIAVKDLPARIGLAGTKPSELSWVDRPPGSARQTKREAP